MRRQVELTFLIGYPSFNSKFEKDVINAVCKLCGGCTVLRSSGYWTEDGTDHKDRFEGDVVKEHAFNLSVTCEDHKVDRVYVEMKQTIAALVLYHNIETNWVHVKRIDVLGMHFDVQREKVSAAQVRDIVSPGTRFAHA